jgi:glutaredoxin
MSQGCTIESGEKMKKWLIDPKTLEKLYPLYYRDIEIGGKFTFPINKKGIVERITSVTKIHTMDGNSDSVQAPEGLANFHTHPLSCYVGEDTVWGWPSGEDIRETLLFGMKGSIVHLVLAIEGVYSMQINPCILSSFMNIESQTELILDDMKKNLKSRNAVKYAISNFISHFKSKQTDTETNLFIKSKGLKNNDELDKYLDKLRLELKIWLTGKKDDKLDYLIDCMGDVIRGLIVLYIEIYYRSSHRFRLHDVNTKISEQLYPIDFIKFVNSFKFSNIFNTGKNIEGCGDLKCGGVPVYEGKKSTVSSFSKYVCDYEKSTGFYMVSKMGETLSLSTSINKYERFNDYIKDIVIGTGCSNNNKWFKMSFAPNMVNIGGKFKLYISKSLTANDRKKFLNYYNENKPTDDTPIKLHKTPTFYFYSMKGGCDHVDITKHLVSNKPKSNQRRKSKKKSKSKKSERVIFYGSKECGWCARALRKLELGKINVVKRYSESIGDAVKKASKYSISNGGEEINTIPAIFINGKYMGGYASVKKVIKNISNN